jgi:predicted RNase H-like nuclease (RuvC/YqgF family)
MSKVLITCIPGIISSLIIVIRSWTTTIYSVKKTNSYTPNQPTDQQLLREIKEINRRLARLETSVERLETRVESLSVDVQQLQTTVGAELVPRFREIEERVWADSA